MSTNREFLMLAQTFDPDKHDIAGWYASTKYDGQRCLWDGGVSRGKFKKDIPWANTNKDQRYTEEQIATGLWSRYGNVIHAPDSWLDALPRGIILDGELYLERGAFQETRTIVSTIDPGPRWKDIRYLVFDSPSPHILFCDGRINNPNFSKVIRENDCYPFFDKFINRVRSFETFQRDLTVPAKARIIERVVQIQLPWEEDEARDKVFELLDKEVAQGGEGLMLRAPSSFWYPKRSPFLLKVKPLWDAEAEIIGYVWGEGKYRGLMGALKVKGMNGKEFNLSGFTDEERILHYSDGRTANGPPGCDVDEEVFSRRFPIGNTVTYRYVSLTNEGIPREARYHRLA